MSISLGQAYLPDVSDMAALQIAIHDRLDELNGTTLSLLKLLAVLGATGEYKTLLRSFQQNAKDSALKV
jgi:predicted ATPase